MRTPLQGYCRRQFHNDDVRPWCGCADESESAAHSVVERELGSADESCGESWKVGNYQGCGGDRGAGLPACHLIARCFKGSWNARAGSMSTGRSLCRDRDGGMRDAESGRARFLADWSSVHR